MLEDIPLDDDYLSGDEEWEEEGEEEGGEGGGERPGAGGERAGGGAGRRERGEERERRVVDYSMFLDEIWSKIAKSKPEAKELSPANLFQEIHSYNPKLCTPQIPLAIHNTPHPKPHTLTQVHQRVAAGAVTPRGKALSRGVSEAACQDGPGIPGAPLDTSSCGHVDGWFSPVMDARRLDLLVFLIARCRCSLGAADGSVLAIARWG